LLWAAGLTKSLFWMTVVSKKVLLVDLKPKHWYSHEETEKADVGTADFEDVLEGFPKQGSEPMDSVPKRQP
jgi:hypothetical protein